MSNSSSEAGESWNIQHARNLYNIQSWGAKYFDINEAGRVVAKTALGSLIDRSGGLGRDENRSEWIAHPEGVSVFKSRISGAP